jgi:hypothetical protein
MTTGLIILAVTIVVFILMGTWFILTKNKINYPEGKRITCTKYSGHKVDVIFQDCFSIIDREALIQACATAVFVVHKAAGNKAVKSLTEVVVLFQPMLFSLLDYGTEFEKRTAAYLGRCGRRLGKSVPMIVVKTKYVAEVIATGEPIIHECCHEILGQVFAKPAGEEHSESYIWAKFGDDTVQAQARKYFLEHVPEIEKLKCRKENE